MGLVLMQLSIISTYQQPSCYVQIRCSIRSYLLNSSVTQFVFGLLTSALVCNDVLLHKMPTRPERTLTCPLFPPRCNFHTVSDTTPGEPSESPSCHCQRNPSIPVKSNRWGFFGPRCDRRQSKVSSPVINEPSAAFG